MNKICFDYLRHHKAYHLKQNFDVDFIERNDLNVWRGNDAIILPLRRVNEDSLLFGRGGVVE